MYLYGLIAWKVISILLNFRKVSIYLTPKYIIRPKIEMRYIFW